jgi:flavin reductase (DIM6/NTAB) family NADH-FMN oxidoreductase RutF
MSQTAASLPYGESEFEKFGIASVPSTGIRPPRVADAPVAFECTLDRIVTIGEGPLAANVIFGRIGLAHIRDEVLDAQGRADIGKLDLIGRLGGEDYATTRDTFALTRPA